MNSPPRKRLKQSTLKESFKKQSSLELERKKSVDKKRDGVVQVAESEECTMTDREKARLAAELIKDNKSPDVTPIEHSSEGTDTLPRKDIPHSEEGNSLKQNHTTFRKTDEAELLSSSEDTSITVIPETPETTPSSSQEEPVAEETTGVDKELVSADDTGADKDNSSKMGSLVSGYKPPARSRNVTEEYRRASKGTPLDILKRAPGVCPDLPLLVPDRHHTVMFNTRQMQSGHVPLPYPKKFEDKWDSDHVKMPCSPENIYPVEVKGKKELRSRWALIQESLLNDIKSSEDLEDAILKYNSRYQSRWDFCGLHQFFHRVLSPADRRHFFQQTLPKMVDLALMLPELCTRAIPLLRRQHAHSVSLTQQQAACLLANAFFSTFPRRNAHGKTTEYSTYPDINFNNLFSDMSKGSNQRKVAKMHCIVNYFQRVTQQMPTGVLTFHRLVMRPEALPEWQQSGRTFRNLHVTAVGCIEDQGQGMLQVDFANKYIGGGVLGNGSVQEEIRFMLCPEMILSRLFTEVLEDNECLIMTGCERFNDYEGYSDSFQWTGDHSDPTPRDDWGRRVTEVVAIDALVFRSYNEQFEECCVRRELIKAYCGFYKDGDPEQLPAVATGNWGCGAFGGNLHLKALVQLMAAAQVGRELCYFTFADCELRDELFELHCLLVREQLTVANAMALIAKYQRYLVRRPRSPSSMREARLSLFDFIHREFSSQTDVDALPSYSPGSHKSSETGNGGARGGASREMRSRSRSPAPLMDFTSEGDSEGFGGYGSQDTIAGNCSPDYKAKTP